MRPRVAVRGSTILGAGRANWFSCSIRLFGTRRASLGAYLNEIGLPDRAIKYITEAPSEGMSWLDHVQAEKLGIAISAWPSAATPPRPPEGPSESLWDYDGSTLLLMTDGVQRKFYYETPRPELVEIGVQRGTLFFVGQQKGRAYRGTALAFSNRCGAIPYSVRGEISEDNQTIVVRGKAPNLDGKCRVKSTWEATLMLVRIGQQSSAPVSTISRPPTTPPTGTTEGALDNPNHEANSADLAIMAG